jgi:hypothetical protein
MRKKLLSSLLALLCLAMAGNAQVLTVSGRISDEKESPFLLYLL